MKKYDTIQLDKKMLSSWFSLLCRNQSFHCLTIKTSIAHTLSVDFNAAVHMSAKLIKFYSISVIDVPKRRHIHKVRKCFDVFGSNKMY